MGHDPSHVLYELLASMCVAVTHDLLDALFILVSLSKLAIVCFRSLIFICYWPRRSEHMVILYEYLGSSFLLLLPSCWIGVDEIKFR